MHELAATVTTGALVAVVAGALVRGRAERARRAGTGERLCDDLDG